MSEEVRKEETVYVGGTLEEIKEEEIRREAEAAEAVEEPEVKTEEELKEEQERREKDEAEYLAAIDKLDSYGLEWTFRSIRYVQSKEKTSFSQLRSCVYRVDGENQFDYLRSVISLVKAGLVGSKQVEDTDAKGLEDKTYEILENWAEDYSLAIMHLLIIQVLEEKHFFTGDRDLGVVRHLSYKNLQKDLVEMTVKNHLAEKMGQTAALRQN